MRLPILLVIFTCLTAVALGDVKRQITAVATPTAPPMDCDLTNPAWKVAPQARGFTDYTTGDHAADQTVASILFDDKNLYIAFDCRDSHPEAIRARETGRDSKFQSSNNGNGPTNTEDNVEFDIDPFLTHNQLDVSAFSVNAIGTRSAAFAGGRGAKAEWSGLWEAVAKRTPTGWVAMLRIPWSILNYPSGKDTVTIGINFSRYIDRTKGLQEWSRTGPQGFLENEGLWIAVHPPQKTTQKKLSLLPYELAGVNNGAFTAKTGVDGRYAVTPQLTAVGSVEPDYSNIEGAIQSIQFSHTAQYLNDVRPFFVEGGNYFNPNINYNNLGAFFYSEQIPTFDLGAKVFGKLSSPDSIGAEDTYSYDGRNDAVMRYLHTFSDTSSGGLMVINKDAPGDENSVFVGDYHNRWGKSGIDLEGANSTGSSDVAATGGGAQLASTYYADKVLTSVYQYSAISSNFYAPDSYIPFTGYKGPFAGEFGTWQWPHGYWREADFAVAGLDWTTNDGYRYYEGVQLSTDVISRSDWYYEFDYTDMYFFDTHDKTIGGQVFEGFTNRFFQLGLRAYTGETAGVTDTYWAPTVKLRVLKKLDVLYSSAIQNRAGLQQQHIATLNYEISPTRSFGGRVVTQNGDTNLYLFYRNSGGRGAEIYFLFGNPDALRTQTSLQVKFVFAL